MTIHYDMPYDAYARLPGWRWSHIKLLHDHSPRHVQHAQAAPDNDTASRRLLCAIHCAVLEPSAFDGRYSCYDGTRRGRAYDAHGLTHPGTEALTLAEWRQCRDVWRAVHQHPAASGVLSQGHPEVVLTWDDAETGLPCKARLDWLADDAGRAWFADLKTAGTTNERRFASTVAKNLWHGQMAHYRAGLVANGITPDACYLIAAEGSGAQDVAVFELDATPPDGPLCVGEALRTRLMRELAACVERDEWPGRHPEVVGLELPAWVNEEPEWEGLDGT